MTTHIPTDKQDTANRSVDVATVPLASSSPTGEDVNPSVEGTGRNRAGIGIYYFEEPHEEGSRP